MSSPIHPNRSVEQPTELNHSTPMVNPNRPSMPPARDSIEMHDAGIFSWIADGFWYIVDCLNAIYDSVFNLVWSFLAAIGLVSPQETTSSEPEGIPFAERAEAAKGGFSEKSCLEQLDIIRKIASEWNDEPLERQGLLAELVKDKITPEFRAALIDHVRGQMPGNEVNEENLAEKLNAMDKAGFVAFQMEFAEYRVNVHAFGLLFNDEITGGSKPASLQLAHLVGLEMVAYAEPFADFERAEITDEWINQKFTEAKARLRPDAREALLQSYTALRNEAYVRAMEDSIGDHLDLARPMLGCAEGQEADTYRGLNPAAKRAFQDRWYNENKAGCKTAWDQAFTQGFGDAPRNNEFLLQNITAAKLQVPAVVTKRCQDFLADAPFENTLQDLLALNPTWTKKFLTPMVTSLVNAEVAANREGEINLEVDRRLQQAWEAYQAAPDAEGGPAITAQLQEAWERKPVEDDREEDVFKEATFKEARRAEVSAAIEREFRAHVNSEFVGDGWCLGDDRLVELVRDHDEQEAIKAAVRVAIA